MEIEDIKNAIDAEQYDRERAAVAFAKLREKAAADQEELKNLWNGRLEEAGSECAYYSREECLAGMKKSLDAAAMRMKCLDLVEARMQAAGVLDWRESPLYEKFLAASGSEKYSVLDALNKEREKKAREVLDEVAREAQAQNNRKLMGCVVTVDNALHRGVIEIIR